jgi:putative transposase
MTYKHKAKIKRKIFINNFKDHINKHKNKLPIKIYENDKTEYETNSLFTAIKYKVNKVQQNKFKIDKFPKNIIKSKKILMILTDNQKQILNSWFTANTNMYNKTIEYLRNNYPLYKDNVIRDKLKLLKLDESNNFYFIRNKLKEEKNIIQKDTQLLLTDKNTKILIHTLDYSIKQVISNLKSAVTNTFKGNFKRFRLKFWKNNRPSQTIEIEKENIKNNKLCYNIFNDIKYIYNKKNYELSNINNNIKINYNSILDEYSLLIPETCEPKESKIKSRNIISLDPGLRIFMTGLSETNAIKLGANVNKIIGSKIRRINKIKKNDSISKKIKNKNEKMINRKITNMVDDLHWKTIKYLTNTYKKILLGDMSAKSIVNNNKSILSPIQKTACLRTRYYTFSQRLEYKCKLTKTSYSLVDEMYTSKICSNCGNYNKDLKAEKIYKCVNCDLSIDRDINGCRNIFMKDIL